MHKRHISRGFTLVELLIVIVVIAILATISTVTYANFKNRAEAAAITAHVRQYATLLEIYIADNGHAPAGNWRCLGDATTLPAENGYEEGFCFKPASNHDGANVGIAAPADPVLMAELKGILGELPSSIFPEAPGASSTTRRGISYDGSTNNFTNFPAVIVYSTKLQTCPIGEKVAWWTGWNPSAGSSCAYQLSVNENGDPR